MTVDRPDGMLKSELEVLQQLVTEHLVQNVLEIGLANASSSIAILEKIKNFPNGYLTSIDPYQNYSDTPDLNGLHGYAGQGLQNIKQSQLADRHIFIESPSYLALPELVKERKEYDLILIDGYHSFDYAFIDFFYADLLLKKGGILLIHDSNWKTVYAVCRYILANKKYSNLGPEVEEDKNNLVDKIVRRLKYIISGRYSEFELRQKKWKSLAALKKEESRQSGEKVLHGVRFK